jgi:hypothetical protein
VGDNFWIVNSYRHSRSSFRQKDSSKAEFSLRFLGITKLQLERHIRWNAQIDNEWKDHLSPSHAPGVLAGEW